MWPRRIRHVGSVNDDVITLLLKQFDLLEYLVRNSGRVLTRGQLIDWVWGADYVGEHPRHWTSTSTACGATLQARGLVRCS
jgi:DNA-binding winged helix-turn-helix (wHTH) protein